MLRRLAPAIGLIVGLVPAMAHAQTNIDEGKTPAQIFASDCSVCHKAPRGLAKGRNSGGIADFLRQHYTASREQAAALAAYILGAGGGEEAHGRKPAAERAAKPEEPAGKPGSRLSRRPPKSEEGPGRAAKLQRGGEEDTRPGEEPIAVEEPHVKPTGRGRRPAATERPESKPTTAATRGRRVAPEPPTREPTPAAAPVAAAPAPAESAPPAATPPAAEPSETSPVPRDDIPD